MCGHGELRPKANEPKMKTLEQVSRQTSQESFEKNSNSVEGYGAAFFKIPSNLRIYGWPLL